jgi:hypothetical protein
VARSPGETLLTQLLRHGVGLVKPMKNAIKIADVVDGTIM